MGFEVIPVIDLLDGRVVHARRGERHAYAPIVSRLCSSAAPDAVVAALASVFDPRIVYVADLDALQGRPAQHDLVRALATAHPGRTFWIDAGIRGQAELATFGRLPNAVPVIASESLEDIAVLGSAFDAVLSLDFRDDSLLDRAGIAQAIHHWPERIIVMTLARVGSDAGPDFGRLAAVQALLERAGRSVSLFAAGGVRGPDDLDALAKQGVAGVLVASALHDGRLHAADVAQRRR